MAGWTMPEAKRNPQRVIAVERDIRGCLRDGNRKELRLRDDCIEWHWSGHLASLLPVPLRKAMPWGYTCRYPHIHRVWIEHGKLFVETSVSVHWVRFCRKDAGEAERCRRFIEERMAPTEELELQRRQWESNPAQYHGRRVRVRAWVRREFEGSFLIWDPAEYFARPAEKRGRTLRFSYEHLALDGAPVESGSQARPMPSVAFMQVAVTIHARGEFLDAAGERARMQAHIAPGQARSPIHERIRDKLFAWVACMHDVHDPDDRIDLRGLDGLFGPMVLEGIFETRPGIRFGIGSSLLTAYHVRQVQPANGARTS